MSKNKILDKKSETTEVTKIVLNEEDFKQVETIVNEDRKQSLDEMSILSQALELGDLRAKMGELKGIETVLDILYNHKCNMMDDTYGMDLKLVADWLMIILTRRGYKF